MANEISCDTCSNYVYDEEEEGYVCDVDMDEDDVARMSLHMNRGCSYYSLDDEYRIVRHQM